MAVNLDLLSQIVFRVGQMLLVFGICCYITALATSDWVVRPNIDYAKEGIDPNQTMVTRNFGIFRACRQNETANDKNRNKGECGDLWDNILFISSNTAKYVQFVMGLAAALYGVSLLLEVVQILPIERFRNFLAKNRVVEMFAAIATVLVLNGMVIFAGEIRNKAGRVQGQDDEQSGWSFIVAMIGLILCLSGLILVTMFRKLPVFRPGKAGGTWLRRGSDDIIPTGLQLSGQ